MKIFKNLYRFYWFIIYNIQYSKLMILNKLAKESISTNKKTKCAFKIEKLNVKIRKSYNRSAGIKN